MLRQLRTRNCFVGPSVHGRRNSRRIVGALCHVVDNHGPDSVRSLDGDSVLSTEAGEVRQCVIDPASEVGYTALERHG